jgi:hypothetical protein
MEAFAQYTWRKDSNQAQLTYLAPAPTDDTSVERWIDLLEHLVATAGNSGVHHIVAEASDDGPEMEVLQSAGFGVFTRQTLFCLTSAPLRADAQPELAGLRPWQHTDDWGLRLLYANTVPQLVQQIEAPADSAFASAVWQHRLVLERNGEIIASVASRRGRIGCALRLLMHPQAEVHVEALLRCGLERLADGRSQPVFCRVRRYEGCLQAPLEACGFELMASTALLVKHTVARVMTPEWHRTAVAEGRAEVTTPVVRARFTRPKAKQTGVDR